MKTRTELLGGQRLPAADPHGDEPGSAATASPTGVPSANGDLGTAKSPGAAADGGAAAFTLLELLVVIAIIGILAAISMPVANSFRPNVTATATRQLLDDISRARQMAIGQRTTVFMVFVPTNFWNDPAYNPSTWTANDRAQATNLFDKQGIGYNFVTLRSLGDQPGQHTARYLSAWRTLPEGTFIPLGKFYDPRFPFDTTPVLTIDTNAAAPWNADISVYRFRTTTDIPFPSAMAPASTVPGQRWVQLPYIAFNYQGQLVKANETPLGRNEVIPLAKGSVGLSRDPATKVARAVNATFRENPVGNVTNAYNVIEIDSLTGRARAEAMEIR